MKLIIAEKPSVGVSLARVLGANQRKEGYFEGNGYAVSWCVGHLVGLAEAGGYDERYRLWRLDNLPIIPDVWKYFVHQNKKAQFATLKKLMNRKDVKSLICATDAGREGELIFRLVYEMANCKKPFERLWISSMEEAAIKKGFDELRDGREYDNLYHSAVCRSKVDWLVGINATRLFTSLHRKKLNVGRVQSPTLAMIVGRHEAVEGFIKEKYHIVRLKMGDVEALSGHIKEIEEAEQIKAACQKRQAVCVLLTKERKTIAPPKLFDLTSLQREANRLFGFTAKETLDSAQKLYEGKLITYPRTDSCYLTSDMAKKVEAIALGSGSFLGIVTSMPIKTAQVINDKKVGDHHAIIPTVEVANISASKLDVTERKLFFLIATRFVCALGDKHEYDAIVATFDCDNHAFTAKGKVVTSDGWKAVDGKMRNAFKLRDVDTDDDDADTESSLSQIAEGQVFDGIDAAVTEHYTQPPKEFTEDTLLSAMERAGVEGITEDVERKGLGTPATRAAIIEKLVKGGFVIRKGRKLIPTAEGVYLISILPDGLKSAELTSDWENELVQIADGRVSPEGFMRRVERMVRELVKSKGVI